MIDILSYPRSGNHLVRYLVEYLTGQATSGCSGNEKVDTFICKRHGVQHLSHVNCDLIVARKYHFAFHITNPSSQLIFILRNPLECIYSHHAGIKGKSTQAFNDILKKYSAGLEYFHAFSGPKLCISYEELVYYNTESSIHHLHNFLKAASNDARCRALLENAELFLDDAKSALLRASQSSGPLHYANLENSP